MTELGFNPWMQCTPLVTSVTNEIPRLKLESICEMDGGNEGYWIDCNRQSNYRIEMLDINDLNKVSKKNDGQFVMEMKISLLANTNNIMVESKDLGYGNGSLFPKYFFHIHSINLVFYPILFFV